MKHQWVKFNEWWSNLALREQRAIAFGGALLGVFIIYQFIWSPLVDHAALLRHQIQTQQKTLVWMQAANKQIQQIEGHSQSKGAIVSPVILLSFLQKQINHEGLESQLSQLKQASNDSVEIQFQKVEFDKLIQLLTFIVKEQAVSISQLSVNPESTPGIVNAGIMLKI